MDFRRPPQNIDVERALLGSILLDNRAHERVAEFLLPEHFYEPVNGLIYQLVSERISAGLSVNPLTLKDMADGDPALKSAGGFGYIASLGKAAVTTINAGNYGRQIHDLFLRRSLIDVTQESTSKAFTDDGAMAQIEGLEQRLFDMTAARTEGGFAGLDSAVAEAVKRAEAAHKNKGVLTGVTTGLKDLDALLGGLHSSDLIILAGRPSMGKTALALTIAFNAARTFNGKCAAFFSLEMDKTQLAARILAEKAQVSGHDLRTGKVAHGDFQRVYEAQDVLKGVPLEIDDTPAPTMSAIRTRCRRLARTKGLGLVVIDYLQLITPAKAENRVQEVSGITRALKALAKELNVPVLALSQLSRAVEQRDDKRPQLSDLRESGTIEQDSDVVMMVYREEYYLARKEPKDSASIEAKNDWATDMSRARNLVDIIVEKQRHGPIGNIVAHFDAAQTSVRDLQKSSYSS